MKNPVESLFIECRAARFGRLGPSEGQLDLYRILNDEVVALCRSLPAPARMNGTRFILDYAGLSVGDELDFFHRYHPPTWSILYWISEADPDGAHAAQRLLPQAAAIHSMAMFLHSLDDHLNDGELAANHLLLLLRSQAWHRMVGAIESVHPCLETGPSLAKRRIGQYYAAILDPNPPVSLEEYSVRFRHQMNTGLIAPELLLSCAAAPRDRMEAFLNAYRHFGCAWRLLDDVQDIEEDLQRRCHSAVYHCLPGEFRAYWDQPGPDDIGGRAESICGFIRENGIISGLIDRIVNELENARGLAEKLELPGFAAEFRSLMMPLQESG